MKASNLNTGITEAIQTGQSYSLIAKQFSVSKSTVTYYARKLGLVKTRGGRCGVQYPWSEILYYYRDGHSYRGCHEKFGISLGGMVKAGKRGLFIPRSRGSGPAMTAEQHAKKLQGKEHGRDKLRAKIIAERLLPYTCAICGIDKWLGNSLTLRLDHIDGNRYNQTMTNFRFLCPNCDSQQSTYGHRNRKLCRKAEQ